MGALGDRAALCGLALAMVTACSAADPPAYVIDLDPQEDRALSPYTGWTRAHYEALFGRLVLGYVQHVSDDGGRVELPDGEGWAPIEGVARMMPAIGAWLSDPANPAIIEVDGTRIHLVRLMRSALVTLSDPEHRERWPLTGQSGSQVNVEAAYVSQFLVQTEDRVWEVLDPPERRQLMNWLTAPDLDIEAYRSNWALFPLMRNIARKRLGYRHTPAASEHYLDTLDGYYVGDGWYRDGRRSHFDYYNSFVIHPELVFWAMWDGDSDPDRSDRIAARTRAYLHHLPYFFASDGSHVPFGRSLTYRSAVMAPVVLAEQAGISPLDSGLSRRMTSGNLRFHMGGDARSTEYMIGEDHVIPIGFLGKRPTIREGYISAGSPYFATRALHALALPVDHPFWSAPEQPLPADSGPFEHVVLAPGFVLFGGGGDEPVSLWNGANEKSESSYNKLNFSSRFTFNRRGTDGAHSYDSAVSVTPNDGTEFWPRSSRFESGVAPGFVYARYSYLGNGAILSTAGINVDDLLVRASCLMPGVEASEHGLRLFEGAHPLLWVECEPPEDTDGEEGEQEQQCDPDLNLLQSGGPDVWEYVRSPTGSVMIAALHGYDMAIPAHGFKGKRNLNLVFEQSVQPALSMRAFTYGPTCVAGLHLARVADFEPTDVRSRVSAVAVDDDRREARFSFDDGTETVWVSLATWTDWQAVELDGYVFEGPLRYARVGPGRLAAAGVDRIRAPDGEVVFEAAATSRSLLLDYGSGLIQSDVAFIARVPGVVGVRSPNVDGTTTDVTDDVVVAGDRVAVTWSMHAARADAQELAQATFTLEID